MAEWRDIPGYETLYQASDDGQIRTCEGKTTRSARFEKRVWKQRIMKQKVRKRSCSSRNSDARVCLWKDGKEKTFLVARLVAMTWCDGYRECLTVNHIDGNSMNNRADNLEWVSISENVKKGFETGCFRALQCPVTLSSGESNLTFRSMSEASRYLGHTPQYISYCISHNRKARGANGACYEISRS